MALVYWIAVPLASVLLRLPFAVVRAAFSRDRWVEATCRWPAEITIRWRTSSGRAEHIASEVAEGLSRGYEGLEFDGAVRESMTEPAGLRDLS